MILTADYHTHTPYSHGKNTVDENACQAKALGLEQLGIADHGFSHVAFGLRRKKVPSCIAEIKNAEQKYGVKVLMGIEANIRGIEGKTDMTEADFENFDFFLCGKHVFIWYDKFRDFTKYGCGNFIADKFRKTPPQKLLEYNTKAYINAIKNNPVDAVTHLGYLCPAHTLEVAKCASDYGTYIELNGKKQHLTDEELCEIIDKTSARFLINSDAHTSNRVGEIEQVKAQLARLDFPFERIDNIDGRLPTFRFQDYKKRL